MQTVLELSYVKARRYFLESQNYCNMQFPVYLDFKPIIEYVQKIIGNKELKDILKDPKKMPSDYENVNHIILVKKDAKYSYRPIQLINPYLYYLLVKAMTNKSSWKEIKDRFAALRVPNIEVASIPKVKGDTDKSHLSASVSSWWENVEQRSLELALSYRYMFVTDITNCYGAIYTHTIAWALMGKDKAKEKRDRNGLLGNMIDNYIQGMQYGQTNGIPQGSVLSDFIAEMVLAYADKTLSEKLIAENISDYYIIRYRDDYRVFCNSKEDIERIAFFLQEVLSELNFHLNTKKTYLTEEVISESIKVDKRAYISEGPIYRKSNKRIYSTMSNLQQEAFFIHQFSKKFPNSGTLTNLLTTFAYRLVKKFADCGNVHVLISIFTDIALSSPKVYKIVLAIISKLINKIPTTDEREQIVNDIYTKFLRFPNIGEIQIWMQRITYNLPHPIAYTEDICKIVCNEAGVELWNNDWVDDAYKNAFPQYKICTEWLRDNYTPVIDIDEALFTIMESRRCLNQGVLERISKIIGDTNDGLSGSEIAYFLKQCNIKDVAPNITKWKRLYSALASVQNNERQSNKILRFVQTVLNPARYTNQHAFETKRKAVNESLSYVGYELQPNGRFREVPVAKTISEAQQRANDLLTNLQIRNAHQEIFKYCQAELVDKNYFHAVFEACKGLFARIRQLSLVNTDGLPLVQYVFNHPVLVINPYQSKQEKDEQKGFEAILEGLCNMFRNPVAHQPKIEWPIDEQDALEILSLISYCHRRLDKAQRID